MRLIHDHHRATQFQHIAERRNGRAAVRPFQQADLSLRQTAEMVHQLAVSVIDLAALCFVHTEGLKRGHDHHRAAVIVRALGIECLAHIHDPHVFAEPLGQSEAIGMCAVPQGIQGLFADCVGGHQPQGDGGVCLQIGVSHKPHRMGGEQGLAPACR